MNRFLTLFCAASLVTGLAAWSIRSRHDASGRAEVPPPPAVESWTREKTTGIVRQLESASTDKERLESAARADRIPVEDLRAALESTPLAADRALTWAAKVLLIKWAARDGGEASRWAWQRFRSEALWDDAFREIAPSWAGHDPKSLATWAIGHRRQVSPEGGSLTLAEAEASDEPILEFDDLDRVSRWLVHEDTRAAFQVLSARGGFSTATHLSKSLRTVDEIQSALLAFDGEMLRNMQPGRFSGSEIDVQSVLSRWNTIDPEGFRRSPYARLLGVGMESELPEVKPWDLASVLDEADRKPVAERNTAMLHAHQVWKEKNPGAQPDMSGWTDNRKLAWEDLEALGD